VVAFSGGVDSVAVTDFLLNGKRDVSLAFFHHGTPTSDQVLPFVESFARERGLRLDVGRLTQDRPPRESLEEFWRNQRYSFLDSFSDPVVTAHHLDDAVETWIFSSLHGDSKLIPYRRGNIVRPFLVSPKDELRSWATRRSLKWMDDSSNDDTRFVRNRIRKEIVPQALIVNPGLRTVLRKKYLSMSLS
jgi:tRNA(Ile)-lysidine synthase